MLPEGEALKFCAHCGAVGKRRLGYCSVCGVPACEHCANTQHLQGEKKIVHNECLGKTTDSFSMIKFIK